MRTPVFLAGSIPQNAQVILQQFDDDRGDYLSRLDSMGVYVNRAEESLPQTVMYDVVLAHFKRERADGKTPKCLVVAYDGARAETLIHSKGLKDSGIQALLDGGGKAYQVYTGGEPSYEQGTSTAPGFTTMLTGRWAGGEGGHGVTSNGINKAQEPKLIFTDIIEQAGAAKTTFVVSWGGHFTNDNASYVNDVKYNREKGNNTVWEMTGSDSETLAKTLEAVAGDSDMVMCSLEHCDSAGHGTGFGNRNKAYVKAFAASESDALALIDALKARPSYAAEDWLILIVSDHGGYGTGHGPQLDVCRQVFIVADRELF